MKRSEPISFKQSWLCEAIHHKESEWGPLDDSKAVRLAQHGLSNLDKIVRRAEELSVSSGVLTGISNFISVGRIVLLLMFVFAIFAGAIATSTVLERSPEPVNITWAIVSLLGINLLSLVLWLFALLSPSASGGILAQLWPWLTRKFARGPDMALAIQSLWSVLGQSGTKRWVLSTVTHVFWLTLSVSASVTLYLMLSTRQYDFVWSTTVLSPEVFVEWTERLATVPKWFGYAVPDSETVLASAAVSAINPESTRRLWSTWLIGCLVAYGILPRLFLSILSVAMVLIRRNAMQPDLSTPYYISVLNRIPSTDSLTDDRTPKDSVFVIPTDHTDQSRRAHQTQNILIAIELNPDDTWPPEGLDTSVSCTEPIDSRESRKLVLDTLMRARPKNLVLACDARHTPDRGSMRLIVDLSELSARTLVWLRHSQSSHAHTEAWLSQLGGLSGIEYKLRDDTASVMQWLERHHD